MKIGQSENFVTNLRRTIVQQSDGKKYMFWVKVSYLVALVLVTPIHYTQVMGKSRVCSKGPPERIGTWELTSVA